MNENNSEMLQELQKISRLLALSYVKGLSQPEAVLELHSAKFLNDEIAELLEAKLDTVQKTILRAKNKK
ncbi:MAG: hypothetical protein IH995_03925 [Proteobacteria bacterium]|nr:hypothetical protein [Pseudomonadota bacterium]